MQIIILKRKQLRINKTSFQSLMSDSSIYFTFNLLFTRVHVERNFLKENQK